MITDEQFADFLSLLYEPRRIEFKGALPRTDGRFFARVARACLGMANLRDGGLVIIGVDEQNGTFSASGLTPSDLASWQAYDDVSSGLASFADPMIRFELSTNHNEGRAFITIEVKEFDEVPIVCKKDSSFPDAKNRHFEVTRAGVCYVRSLRRTETSAIPTQTEMREVLDLAIEKGVRRFVTRAHAVGLDLTGTAQQDARNPFQEQVLAIETDSQIATVARIRERGYWRVAIHPGTFQVDRVGSIGDLYPLFRRHVLRLRSWDFPHWYTENGVEYQPGLDWIELGTEISQYREFWRFYQSGQFVDYRGMSEDWLEESTTMRGRFAPSEVLFTSNTVHSFTEIFEFAARLALTDAYNVDDNIRVSILIHGLRNRRLFNDNPNRTRFMTPRVTALQEFPYEITVPRDELLGSVRSMARRAARELFLRFAWDASDQLLEGIQDELPFS